jgi:DNA invertase Pin-like site-specific DNA recombinase
MPTAYSYIRFSSEKQKHGASLDRQRSMVANWKQANPEYIVSDVKYEDLGISGWSGVHLDNAFGRLLAAIEHGAIKPGDTILVEAIDRAGRMNPDKMLNILTSITSAGVSITSLDDGAVYSSDPTKSNNLFLLVAKVQQAWSYSDALSRRVKDAYQRKREKAAQGITTKRRTPAWLTSDGKLIPEVARFVVQAFEDYAAGLGERRIHRRIYEHPECPEQLKKLSPGTVKKWFNNRTAIGYWGETPNVYPAAVSAELFYLVQKRMAEKYKPKPSGSRSMMVGLVKCARCGSNLIKQDTKVSPPTFICVRYIRLGKTGCDNNRSIPYQILDHIRAETTFEAMQRVQQLHKMTHTEKRMIVINGELDELRRQRDNAVSLAIKYGETPRLAEELEKLTANIKQLETEQKTLENQPNSISVDAAIELHDDMLDDDQEKLGALLEQAGYRIVCDGHNITVNEPAISDPSPIQNIVYNGVNRKAWTYKLTWNGRQMEILTPRGLALANAQPDIPVDVWNSTLDKIIGEG